MERSETGRKMRNKTDHQNGNFWVTVKVEEIVRQVGGQFDDNQGGLSPGTSL